MSYYCYINSNLKDIVDFYTNEYEYMFRKCNKRTRDQIDCIEFIKDNSIVYNISIDLLNTSIKETKQYNNVDKMYIITVDINNDDNVFSSNDISIYINIDNYNQLYKIITSYLNTKLAINPLTFYSNKCNNIVKVFPKQELACKYMDSLSKLERNDLKIYSFESKYNGQRKFLIASINKFIDSYCDTKSVDKHVYEIIRENIPCRLYFDLEFKISSNIDEIRELINKGDRATATWIDLVILSIYEKFNIQISTDNVVVLDSSNSNKYSKHIIIHIINNNTEYLFRNNISINSFIQYILYNITDEIITNDDTIIRKPKSKYLDLWFENFEAVDKQLVDVKSEYVTDNNLDSVLDDSADNQLADKVKTNKKSIFIVDLSVYTKNRAFRLFLSSKYNKTTALKDNIDDSKIYKGLPQSTNQSYKEILKNKLLASFIIPYNIFNMYSYEILSTNSTDEAITEQHEEIDSNIGNYEYKFKGNFLECDSLTFNQLYKTNLVREFSILNEFGLLDNTTNYMTNSDKLNSKRLTNYNSTFNKDNIILSSNIYKKPSPFPLLDDIVIQLRGSIGGIKGEISGWTIYKSPTKSNPPIYRIRYQILHNRYCDRIKRFHKSNHIQLEVDYYYGSCYQLCWDPECIGYKSDPIFISHEYIPDYKELCLLDGIDVNSLP